MRSPGGGRMEIIMYIHTVKEGESVYSISGIYGVSPQKIIENNGLKNPERISCGRELLILIPTRTYTVRRGDTAEGIARRFSLDAEELIKNNPRLSERSGLYPEEILALKYPERSRGIALLNGYVYKGTPKERLRLFMPYLSHLTLSSKLYKNGKIHTLFDSGSVIKEAKAKGKRTQERIYGENFDYNDKKEAEKFASLAVREGKESGADGITLSLPCGKCSEGLSDFIFLVKKAALSEGLSLFVECGGKKDGNLSEIADITLINYDALADAPMASFEEGEKKFYTEAAAGLDMTRSFADISPFAYSAGTPMPIEEADALCDRRGTFAEYDEKRMLLRRKTKSGELLSPSLKNIKAKLDLLCELGILGYSVDIMRSPISHLMLLHSMFTLSPSYFSGGI